MSKFDKFKEILGIGTAIAKPFVPGKAGSILDAVNGALDKSGPTNAEPAVKALAQRVDEYNEQQDQAILALHERLKKLEQK